MNIGIILYSQTGHTLAIGREIERLLVEKGHQVHLEQIRTDNPNPSSGGPVTLRSIPDTTRYDLLILGAQVWGFSLSAVMRTYLDQLPSLKGKKVGCFLTQHFPFSWMGGNQAMKQLMEACRKKDASVTASGIVHWSSSRRDAQTAEVAQMLATMQ